MIMQPTSDAFLEGTGIPVALPAIEDELNRLWGPAAEKAGGPELDHPSVTRVVLANVVIVQLSAEAVSLEETLQAISEHHPSRVIVVRSSGNSGRQIAAEVTAQCHLPAPGRPQVCSERIVLKADTDAHDLLPGAVRSLLESGLHSVLWWCDDPRSEPRLLDQLAEGATRLILDRTDPSADPEGLAEGLDPDRSPLPRDVSWFGITPIRELVAQRFDPPATDDLHRITAISVQAEAPATDGGPRPARLRPSDGPGPDRRPRPPSRRLAGRLARRSTRLAT